MRKSFWNLNVGVIANLSTRVIEISQKPAYAVLVKNVPFLGKLINSDAAYHTVIDKPAFSGLGKPVKDADELRDKRFLGLKKALLAMIQLDGITNHQDAVELYALFEKHGIDLYNYTYDDETTHLKQLILDLEKPENAARLQRLNLTEGFTLLKAAESAFEQLTSSQTEANSVLRGMESASSLYKDLADSLRNYVNYVNGMSEIDSQWQALSLEINEALKAANNAPAATKAVATAAPIAK